MRPFLHTVLLLAVWWAAQSCAMAEGPLPPPVQLPPMAREVTVEEARELVKAGRVTILDVRTAPEVQELGQIPGAKHADFFREDFGPVVKERLKLDPKKPCLVYCALGGRAQRAAPKLAALGFVEILVLKDGFNGWVKAGGSVSK